MTTSRFRFNKTRIAPTPSGFLHLGNAYSFVLTQQMAFKYGAEVLLRIDDMDALRVRKEYLEDIFDCLNFLGISWQQGPASMKEYENFSQKSRMQLYNSALQILREKDLLYACVCSRTTYQNLKSKGEEICRCREKRIPLEKNEAAWRLVTDPGSTLTITDAEGTRTKLQFPLSMTDFIVKKKDGDPSYQLTSVVDDLFFKVDLIVRGEDLLPSTCAQLFLAPLIQADAFCESRFLHHALLKNEDGKKLSKSDGAESVRSLIGAGISRQQLFSKLGFGSGSENNL
jgi:glutamyl/glutaminyl-tRNA synthetase